MNYDKIRTSSPVNATAARVVSRSGIQWKPAKDIDKSWHTRTAEPLPTEPFSGPKEYDLSGRCNNRLTVIGKAAGFKSNDKGAAWVVRCTCGYYEIRRTSGFKNTEYGRSMCRHCDYLEELKAGKEPPEFPEKKTA